MNIYRSNNNTLPEQVLENKQNIDTVIDSVIELERKIECKIEILNDTGTQPTQQIINNKKVVASWTGDLNDDEQILILTQRIKRQKITLGKTSLNPINLDLYFNGLKTILDTSVKYISGALTNKTNPVLEIFKTSQNWKPDNSSPLKNIQNNYKVDFIIVKNNMIMKTIDTKYFKIRDVFYGFNGSVTSRYTGISCTIR